LPPRVPCFVQAALVVPLVWRRRSPTAVFVVIAIVAVIQWVLGYRLVADISLLVALYTVAVHDSYRRVVAAAVILEVGVGMASARWAPAGSAFRSFNLPDGHGRRRALRRPDRQSGERPFLVVGRNGPNGWSSSAISRRRSRRRRERAHIAREMHDVVTHSLSVVVTLADAASVVSQSDPQRAAAAMDQVADVGRRALADMRAIVGVLGTDDLARERLPQPGLGQLDDLFEAGAGHRARGDDARPR